MSYQADRRRRFGLPRSGAVTDALPHLVLPVLPSGGSQSGVVRTPPKDVGVLLPPHSIPDATCGFLHTLAARAALKAKATACLLVVLFVSVCLAQPPATRAPESSPRLGETPKQQGIALAVDGQYDKALRIFQTLLRDSPDSAELNYLAGASCVRMERLAEGIDYLENAVKSKPGFPQAYGELAEAYLKRRMKDRARATMEEGLRLFPKNEQLKKTQAKLGN